jgi:hypothetical protein
MSLVFALLGALRASLRTRTDLALENLALRQQLVLLRRRSKRPQFGRRDRLFWVWLSRRWAGWREALHRSPRDRDSLASARLPRFLDLEVMPQAGRSTTRLLKVRTCLRRASGIGSPVRACMKLTRSDFSDALSPSGTMSGSLVPEKPLVPLPWLSGCACLAQALIKDGGSS